jgi:hypothetical protein
VNTIEQLRSAPVQSEGPDAGKAVDGKWESEHGHALAALRYGAMSRPSPSSWPEAEPADWEAYAKRQALLRHEYRVENADYTRVPYSWS